MPNSHYEPGSYLGKITGQRFGTIPNSGTPFFAIEFEPTQSTGANGFPDVVYKREVTLFVTEKAAKYTIEKLRELGWNGTQFSNLDPATDKYHSFEGQEVALTCEINDKGYDSWNLAYSGESKESDPAVANRLDNLFGKALVSSVSAKPAQSQKPQQEAPAADPSPGEVPF